MKARLPVALALLAAALPALAHPGHTTQGFAAGFLHPLTGADHLLAMVAVGLWAVQGRTRTPVWLPPLAFLAAVAAGAALAFVAASLPAMEPAVAGSVLALGLIIALGKALPPAVAAALAALAGLIHGHAHGAGMPPGTPLMPFSSGLLLSTALLHAVGVWAGARLARGSGLRLRAGGGLIALLGVAAAGL